MPRGIAAFVLVASLVFSMTILGGVGFYGLLGEDIDLDAETQNADVQAAAEELSGISFGEGRSSAILQGPLAVVTPVVGILQTFVATIGNTSGILQLLFGVPPVVGDTLETLFRIAMLVTVVYAIRSGSPV